MIEIETTNCENWEQYCQAVRMGDGSPIDPIYRGQAMLDWPLVAPSGREKYKSVKEMLAAGIEVQAGGPADQGQLKYFVRLSKGLPNGVNLDELGSDDIEALARHHGLCSNLLDWTRSPYVAAFFAFTSALDLANDGRLQNGTLGHSAIFIPMEPVSIYRLSVSKELWVGGEFELVTSLSNVNFWQKAQSALFTRLYHVDYLDILDYLQSKNFISRIHKYVVPGGETGKVLGDLEAMNITYATLFPDLNGAALQANVGPTWQHLWSIGS